MTTQPNYEPAGFPSYLATVRDLVWEEFGITLSFRARAEAHACYEIGRTPAQCARIVGHRERPRLG